MPRSTTTGQKPSAPEKRFDPSDNQQGKWGPGSIARSPLYRTLLPTTAGAGVSSDVSEVLLIYQFDWEQYELCRAYTNSLPRASDGIFLVFPGTTPEEVSAPLRFTVLQVCHVLLDQSHVDATKEGQDYIISNQVTIYVEPRDMTARSFCNQLIEQSRARREENTL